MKRPLPKEPKRNKFIRQLKKAMPEWTPSLRNNGHIKWTHAKTGNFVFGAQTPSDHRGVKNLMRDMHAKMR